MMVKAIDLIGNNAQLQNHWVRRIVAAIIDAIIIWIIALIIAFIIVFAATMDLWILMGFGPVPWLFWGLIWVLYFVFLEWLNGYTVGKRLMSLRVVSTAGPMDIAKAFIRNISKIFWVAIIVDWLVGFVTDGDPRQRFLDRMANTTVVRTDVQEIFHGAYQPPPGPMPRPYTQPSREPQYQAKQAPGPVAQPTPYPMPSQSTQPYQPTYGAPLGEDYEPPPPTDEDLGPVPPMEEKVGPEAVAPVPAFTRGELVNMKKDELIKIARDRGLKVSGTKRDLIDRILGEEVEG